MTVAELIEVLKKLPQDAQILYEVDAGGSYPASECDFDAEAFRFREYDGIVLMETRW